MSVDPRPLLVEICHLLAARNFTTATGGNVSVRFPDGSFWVTPTRLHKARVQIDDLVRVDAACTKLEGARQASSETLVHLAMYQALPQAGAVIHAHPPASTGYAQAYKAIDTSSSSEAYVILGREVPLIRYDRPSTAQLATLIGKAMQADRKAYLMANHGVLTWGEDLRGAYNILDTLEILHPEPAGGHTARRPGAHPGGRVRWLDHKFNG